MAKDRAILHVDMDAFFASVEALESPELRGKPLIVGGDGARGVVASCSYEARFYGVRSAMPSVRAKRLCPSAVFVRGRYWLYENYSRRMHEVFERYTPLVEGISLDEAFLDVTGAQKLFGPAADIARAIRTALREELGLPASVGVATTKHVAKLASVAAKPTASRSGPVPGRGVMVIGADEVFDFLHPLPVRALWGVGPKAADKLARIGIDTVGQLARFPLPQLQHALGQASGKHLHELAWNRDDRPVVPSTAAKSVGHEQTYSHDLRSHAEMHAQFLRLADAVTTRMRKSGVAGRTLTVKVRYASFETITRSRTVPNATAHTTTLARLADELTAGIDPSGGIRLLGLSMSNLEELVVAEQLELEGAPEDEELRLDDVVDRIRERYGTAAVVPAPLLGPQGPKILRKGDQQWGPSGE